MEKEIMGKLKVIKEVKDDAPYTYIQLRFGSGGAADIIPGTAHFLEHQMFNSSEAYDKFTYADTMAMMGCDRNAHTSHDETVYKIKVPHNYAIEAAQTFANHMKTLKFDSVEIEKERGVILEEVRSSDNDMLSKAFEFSGEQLYTGTAYKNTVLGKVADVEAITAQTLQDYYKENYLIDNAILTIISSDEEIAEAIHMTIALALNEMGEGFINKNWAPLTKVPDAHGNSGKFDQMSIFINYKMDKLNLKESLQLELLGNILFEPFTGRVWNRLREELGLCYGCGGYISEAAKTDDVIMAYIFTAPENKDQAQIEMVKIIKGLFEERNVTEKEMKMAKIKMETSRVFSEATDKRAAIMTRSYIKHGYIVSDCDEMQYISNIDLNEIEKAIDRFKDIFTGDYTVISYL